MGCICAKEEGDQSLDGVDPEGQAARTRSRRTSSSAAPQQGGESTTNEQHHRRSTTNGNGNSVPPPLHRASQDVVVLSSSAAQGGNSSADGGRDASSPHRASNPLVGRPAVPPPEAGGVLRQEQVSSPAAARRTSFRRDRAPSPPHQLQENPLHTPTDTTTLTSSRSANSSINSTAIVDDEPQQQQQQQQQPHRRDHQRHEQPMPMRHNDLRHEAAEGAGVLALGKDPITRLTVTTSSVVSSPDDDHLPMPLQIRRDDNLPPAMALNDDGVVEAADDARHRVGGNSGLPPLPPPSINGSGSTRTTTTTTTTNNTTTTTTSSVFGSQSDGHRSSTSGLLLTPPGSNRLTAGGGGGGGGFLGAATPGTMSSATPTQLGVAGNDAFIPLRSKRRPTAETDDASSFLHVGGFKRSSVSSSLPTHSSSHSLRTIDTFDRNTSFFDRRASRDLYSATTSPIAQQRVMFDASAGGGGGVVGEGTSSSTNTQSTGSSSIALPQEPSMSSPFRQHRVPSHSGAVNDEAVMERMRMRTSPTGRQQYNFQGRGFTVPPATTGVSYEPQEGRGEEGSPTLGMGAAAGYSNALSGGALQITLSQSSLGSMVSSRNNLMHGVRPPPQITSHQLFQQLQQQQQQQTPAPSSPTAAGGGVVAVVGDGGASVSSGAALPISSGRHATAKPLQGFPAIGIDAASPYSTPAHRSTRSQNSFHLEPVNSSLYRQPQYPLGGSAGDFNDSLTTPSVLLSGRHDATASGEDGAMTGGVRRGSDAPSQQALPPPPTSGASRRRTPSTTHGADDFMMPIHPKRLVVGGTLVDGGGTSSVAEDDVISVSSFTSTSAGALHSTAPPPRDDSVSESASDRTLPPSSGTGSPLRGPERTQL